jgi:hypothetical protein
MPQYDNASRDDLHLKKIMSRKQVTETLSGIPDALAQDGKVNADIHLVCCQICGATGNIGQPGVPTW